MGDLKPSDCKGAMVNSDLRENGGNEESACPTKGGAYFPHACPSPNSQPKEQNNSQAFGPLRPQSVRQGEFIINTPLQPSPRVNELLDGINEPADAGNPTSPPSWLDKELFDRGREFYRRYLFCLSCADLLSLLLMLSNPRALKPLIFTGRSDTNDKAMRRYFSTLLHVMTWYEGDVWDPNDPAHKDVLSIRSIHNKVAQLVNSSRNHEKVKNIKVTDKGHVEPECPYYPSIREDMRRVAENALGHQESSQPLTYLNQLDMSLTQYSFFGLLVAHPKKLGAGAATEEEFEGLIHFWRGIGWLLGIDDKYNFCSGNLAETRALCLEVEKFFAIPWLASADWDHEHMTTCLMSGMNTLIFGLSFPSMFRYLTHVLDVPAPEFESRLSFVHTLQYWLLRFVFALILVIPSLVIILNRMFKKLIEMVQNESNKPKNMDSRIVKNVYT